MGTESAYPLGTILRRKKPQGNAEDELRVIGGGKRLVVTPNKGFGTNLDLDAAVVRTDYDVEFPEGVEPGQIPFNDPGLTPEQIFALTSPAPPPSERLSRMQKAAIRDDELQEAAIREKTDTPEREAPKAKEPAPPVIPRAPRGKAK